MIIMSNSDEPLSKELVSVYLTPEISDFLKSCVKLKLLGELPDQDSCDLDNLLSLAQKYNSSKPELYDLEKVNLTQLMKNTCIVDRKKVTTDSARKLTDIELMRRRAKEREYQQLIGNTNIESPKENLADYKRSLALGTNLLLGIILTFLAGYWGLLYLGITETTTRAAVGMVFSIICLITEVSLFLLRDAREIASHKSKSRPKHATYKFHQKPEQVKEPILPATEATVKDQMSDSKEAAKGFASSESFLNSPIGIEPKFSGPQKESNTTSSIEKNLLSTFTSSREDPTSKLSKRSNMEAKKKNKINS